MRVSITKKKKCGVIQVMIDKDYVNKRNYITILHYCGSSHYRRCSGLNLLS